MAQLVILYGHPVDPQRFEEYYEREHIPYAAEHMPNVVGAENLRVLQRAGGEPADLYRVSRLEYSSLEALREGIESEAGRAVLADLDNFATGGATVLIADA